MLGYTAHQTFTDYWRWTCLFDSEGCMFDDRYIIETIHVWIQAICTAIMNADYYVYYAMLLQMTVKYTLYDMYNILSNSK